MDARRDEDHRLALSKNLLALAGVRGAVPEIQPPRELPVPLEVLDRVGVADEHADEWVAVRGGAQLLHPHPIRRGRRELHVLDELVPARQLVVGADLEPDKLVGRLQRAGRVESFVGGGQARGRGEHEQPPQSIRNGPVANGH